MRKYYKEWAWFLDRIEDAALYVAHNINPLSDTEFEKLKSAFSAKTIMVNIRNIQNRKDLRNKNNSYTEPS